MLTDDDGRVWLYSGFAPVQEIAERLFPGRKKTFHGGSVMELESDMLTVGGEPKRIFDKAGEAAGTSFHGHEFFEASSIRKIGTKYYFLYSSVHGHELCYAVSDRPDGGFTFGGTVIGNNHGSIVQIRGQWYVFHHRQTNRHQSSRQPLAEAITIRPDGSIPQVWMTSCGLNGGPLRGRGVYEARIACHPYFTQDGGDRDHSPDQHIANLRQGATAGFRWFALAGNRGIRVTVRGGGRGSFRISAGPEGPERARVGVEPSPEWTTFASTQRLPDGVTALYFTFEGGGAVDLRSFELM